MFFFQRKNCYIKLIWKQLWLERFVSVQLDPMQHWNIVLSCSSSPLILFADKNDLTVCDAPKKVTDFSKRQSLLAFISSVVLSDFGSISTVRNGIREVQSGDYANGFNSTATQSRCNVRSFPRGSIAGEVPLVVPLRNISVYDLSASYTEATVLDGLRLFIVDFYPPITKKIVSCAVIYILLFRSLFLNTC